MTRWVGNELHPAAVAERTDITLPARHAGEHLAAALERRLVAAGEYDEVLSGRLGAGAAYRAVEQDLALGCELRLPACLHLDRQGAAFDDDLAHAVARGDAALACHNLLEGIYTRQGGDQDLGLFGSVARRGGGDPASLREPRHRSVGDVIADDLEAVLYEVAHHRRAHDANADNADALRHNVLPKLCRRSANRD